MKSLFYGKLSNFQQKFTLLDTNISKKAINFHEITDNMRNMNGS